MKRTGEKSSALSRWASIAEVLNWRVIRTPYFKSTIYFLIALAICLIFYLIITHLPRTF